MNLNIYCKIMSNGQNTLPFMKTCGPREDYAKSNKT